MTDLTKKLVISADELMNIGVIANLHGEDYRLVSVSKEPKKITLEFRMPDEPVFSYEDLVRASGLMPDIPKRMGGPNWSSEDV